MTVKERLILEDFVDRESVVDGLSGTLGLILVVEVLFLKELDKNVLWKDTNEAASGVQNWIGIVMGLESLLAGVHVRDRVESDQISSHDSVSWQVSSFHWSVSTEEWHLLHAEGTVVERSTEEVGYSSRGQDADHHWKEDVDT